MSAPRVVEISPYFGSHSEHPRCATIRRYGSDQSGTKTYTFNSLGYRGAEPNPMARARILTSGCSYTFGEGLDYHEAWVSQFVRLYARQQGLAEEDVDLINLAQGGASNDYIARTVVPHLERVEPNLVVVLFAYKNRAEVMLDDPGHPPVVASLGPWAVEPDPRRAVPSGASARRAAVRAEGANHHYLTYTDDSGLISALKNMLLVQLGCRAAGIDYVFAWVEHGLLEGLSRHPNPIVRDLAASLDLDGFCPTAPTDPERQVDLAPDGVHPGPLSNARFAEDILATWLSGGVAGAAGQQAPQSDNR